MAYNRDRAPKEDNGPEMIEKVVYLNRVSKTVKGGRVMKFSALVVVGDGKGTVGYGLGKAAEVSEAILKGIADAKKNMVKITLEGTTIPHDIIGEFGAGREAGSRRHRHHRRRRCPCCHGSSRHFQHSCKVPALEQPAERCQGNDAGSDLSARRSGSCAHQRQERGRHRRLRRAQNGES